MQQYLADKTPLLLGFYRVLTQHRFQQTSHEGGITWLELMLLSLAHSSDIAETIATRTAKARPTVQRLLASFRAQALLMIKYALTPA